MGKLLCLIGLHKWINGITDKQTHLVIVKKCKRCNKELELDFWDLKWNEIN
jgi:hypothetical protein